MAVGSAFKDALGPQLQAGARAATGEVMSTVRGWGSMHWATYKASGLSPGMVVAVMWLQCCVYRGTRQARHRRGKGCVAPHAT